MDIHNGSAGIDGNPRTLGQVVAVVAREEGVVNVLFGTLVDKDAPAISPVERSPYIGADVRALDGCFTAACQNAVVDEAVDGESAYGIGDGG